MFETEFRKCYENVRNGIVIFATESRKSQIDVLFSYREDAVKFDRNWIKQHRLHVFITFHSPAYYSSPIARRSCLVDNGDI